MILERIPPTGPGSGCLIGPTRNMVPARRKTFPKVKKNANFAGVNTIMAAPGSLGRGPGLWKAGGGGRCGRLGLAPRPPPRCPQQSDCLWHNGGTTGQIRTSASFTEREVLSGLIVRCARKKNCSVQAEFDMQFNEILK